MLATHLDVCTKQTQTTMLHLQYITWNLGNVTSDLSLICYFIVVYLTGIIYCDREKPFCDCDRQYELLNIVIVHGQCVYCTDENTNSAACQCNSPICSGNNQGKSIISDREVISK